MYLPRPAVAGAVLAGDEHDVEPLVELCGNRARGLARGPAEATHPSQLGSEELVGNDRERASRGTRLCRGSKDSGLREQAPQAAHRHADVVLVLDVAAPRRTHLQAQSRIGPE